MEKMSITALNRSLSLWSKENETTKWEFYTTPGKNICRKQAKAERENFNNLRTTA